MKSVAAATKILSYDAMGFLEKFLEGQVDLRGNLYSLTELKNHAHFELSMFRAIPHLVRGAAFQNTTRARVNVKSHYDIPQEALDVYLDRKYMSYSCGMFEDPKRFHREALLAVGEGEKDDFDSLEKAQWRKFKDAVDFLAPAPGETLLDVGCGYGGQLMVALENHPFGNVVGWTISANQVTEGRKMLSGFDPNRWEINDGDYRQEHRVFDHVEKTVRPGKSAQELFHEVQAILDQAPVGVFNHHLGHGIGLFPHEAPHLNPSWDDTFEQGEVFTAEPGLYAPELKAGMRIENNYLVTEDGIELLTDFSLEL